MGRHGTTVEYSVPDEDPEASGCRVNEETVPDIVNLTGSAMADILAGDSRDNTIKGGGGDDKLYGGPGGGDDDLQGEGGDDMLFGGRGDDDLFGGMGNDSLWGGPGVDDFYGGAGNDMIYADEMDVNGIDGGSPGVIDGGSDMDGGGMDTVSFEKLVDTEIGTTANPFTLGSREGPTELVPAGPIPEGVEAVNIENVIGTDEDDFITGEANSPNEIEGGDGGDTLVGGEGDGDTVSYASSDRRVRVDLGDGSTLEATGSSNSGGHATGDTISGFENIKGTAYGDVLTALNLEADNPGSTLWGLGGDDTLVGGNGDDTLEGGAGADEVDGGFTATEDADADGRNSQMNTLSYAGSDAGVTVDLASSTASGGHAQGDEIETYEYDDVGDPDDDDDDEEIDIATFVNVTGSAHNDSLYGDRFGNHLVGGAGDDSLRGGAGGDILSGGPGADRMDGGSSTTGVDDNADTPDVDESKTQHEDWAAYRSAKDNGVTVNLNTGRGTAGDAMGDTLKNIELIWGSKQDDTFIASSGADTIHGDGGSDTVSYEASKHGVTVMLANASGQWSAGAPNETPATMDMFDEATDDEVMNWRVDNAERPDVTPVEADDGLTTTKSYAEGDMLYSIENVTGSRGNDLITGDIGAGNVPNVIKGGGGNDTLNGGSGNDKLHGGAGNDTLGARPVIDGDEAAGIVAEDALTDAGDDMMYGDAGNDKLYGGDGADTLVGGAGDDDLDGGADNDTFVFGPGDGSDVITGFAGGTDGIGGDKIDLSAFDIDPDDLDGLISVRAGNSVINLEDYGGGRVTIQGVTDTLVQTLFIDEDGDGVFEASGEDGEGVTDTGDVDGIFIL